MSDVPNNVEEQEDIVMSSQLGMRICEVRKVKKESDVSKENETKV